MLDTRTPEFTIGETVLAHTGGISQLETEGNYIVTVGFTMRSVPSPSSTSLGFAHPLSRRHTGKGSRSLTRTSSSTTRATCGP